MWLSTEVVTSRTSVTAPSVVICFSTAPAPGTGACATTGLSGPTAAEARPGDAAGSVKVRAAGTV